MNIFYAGYSLAKYENEQIPPAIIWSLLGLLLGSVVIALNIVVRIWYLLLLDEWAMMAATEYRIRFTDHWDVVEYRVLKAVEIIRDRATSKWRPLHICVRRTANKILKRHNWEEIKDKVDKEEYISDIRKKEFMEYMGKTKSVKR